MWERLSGVSGSMSDYLAGDVPTGQAIVEILPTDKAFKNSGCGTWELVGEAASAQPDNTMANIVNTAYLSVLMAIGDLVPLSAGELDEIEARARSIGELFTRDMVQRDSTRVFLMMDHLTDSLREWVSEQG